MHKYLPEDKFTVPQPDLSPAALLRLRGGNQFVRLAVNDMFYSMLPAR